MLGGTFDPIHQGHIATAKIASKALGNLPVAMMLAPYARLRNPAQATKEQRWQMVVLACQNEDMLLPDSSELQAGETTRTIDTVTQLGGSQNNPIIWILSDDAARRLPQWVGYEDLRQRTSFFMFDRIGADLTRLREDFEFVSQPRDLMRRAGCIYISNESTPAVSATEIRHQCARGIVPTQWLHEDVRRFIIRQNLYVL